MRSDVLRPLTGFPTAASMVGFAYALKNVAWVYWTAMLIAAAHLVSAGAYANSGMLSPSGVGVYVAPVLYCLWIGAISVWIRR